MNTFKICILHWNSHTWFLRDIHATATSPENAFWKESFFFELAVSTAVACNVENSSGQETAGALAVQQNVQEVVISGDLLFLFNYSKQQFDGLSFYF